MPLSLHSVIISLLATAATTALATASAHTGDVVPCANGFYEVPNGDDVRIHCNTSYRLPPPYLFHLRSRQHQTFNSCVETCFGQYEPGYCCAAQFYKHNKTCLLIDYGGSACGVEGFHFVGPSNDTTNLVVLDN